MSTAQAATITKSCCIGARAIDAGAGLIFNFPAPLIVYGQRPTHFSL